VSRKLHRLEVQWVDSHGDDSGWQQASYYMDKKVRRPMMHSVGFVLADDKKGIVLAGSVDPQYGNVCNVICIPREAVVSKRRRR
jgi:hypothetical protein